MSSRQELHSFQLGVHVLLNMSEQNNGQALTVQNPEAAQGFTAERVLRTRPKTYRAIVQLLAGPHASVNQIAKFHRVTIAERKKTLVALLANVAELGAERMEETIGAASLRDAAIGTGVAVDKVLALTGQMPSLQIANITLPSAEERAKLDAIDRNLDAITAMLAEAAAKQA
jgi:hypothetical protein